MSREPLELGLFKGVLDEVRIENPTAPPARRRAVAVRWRSGRLHRARPCLSGENPEFAPVPGGQALKPGPRGLTDSQPSRLAARAGLGRIDCSVYFDKLPTETRHLAIKDGEYQLRLNSPAEGGCFAFFVNLDGWEPRVCDKQRVVPGQWYRVTACWDGSALTLDVNGQRTRVTRSGLAKPTDDPLVIGGLRGLIDNVRIENPRLPTFQVHDARQAHAILLVGRPEKLTTTVRNVGTTAKQVAVRFELPPGVRAWARQSTSSASCRPEPNERSSGASRPRRRFSIRGDSGNRRRTAPAAGADDCLTEVQFPVI